MAAIFPLDGTVLFTYLKTGYSTAITRQPDFLKGSVFATDSRIRGDGFIIFGGPDPLIDVVNLAPYGVLSIHTIRLTVVEGPVPVPPGVPVEVSLGFAGPEDHSVGPTQTVTLSPAQTASLDLDVSTVLFIRPSSADCGRW